MGWPDRFGKERSLLLKSEVETELSVSQRNLDPVDGPKRLRSLALLLLLEEREPGAALVVSRMSTHFARPEDELDFSLKLTVDHIDSQLYCFSFLPFEDPSIGPILKLYLGRDPGRSDEARDLQLTVMKYLAQNSFSTEGDFLIGLLGRGHRSGHRSEEFESHVFSKALDYASESQLRRAYLRLSYPSIGARLVNLRDRDCEQRLLFALRNHSVAFSRAYRDIHNKPFNSPEEQRVLRGMQRAQAPNPFKQQPFQ